MHFPSHAEGGCIFLLRTMTIYNLLTKAVSTYLGMLGHSGCNEVPKPPAKCVYGLAQYKKSRRVLY